MQRANDAIAERRLLSSFTSRLIGTGGRQVRLIRPTSVEEAIRIAHTAIQVDEHDARNSAFYANAELAESSPSGRVRDPGKRYSGAQVSKGSTVGKGTGRNAQKRPNNSEPTGNAPANARPTCPQCGGAGHYARQCPSRVNASRSGHGTRPPQGTQPGRKPKPAECRKRPKQVLGCQQGKPSGNE
jgi:hypothetical protein